MTSPISDFAIQVLAPDDAEAAYIFAEARLNAAIADEPARALASWAVPWRREALAHYLPLWWSFAARHDGPEKKPEGKAGKLAGFFMAQPFLFMRGQTQTLWIEHVEAESPEAVEALVDVATRAAREKHLQRALFNDAIDAYPGYDPRAAPSAAWVRASLGARGAERIGPGLWQIKTTKG